MTPTTELHARLTTLGKVPEGLELYQRGTDRPQWYFHDLLLHNFAVPGLLRDAARRYLDSQGVCVDEAIDCDTGNTVWCLDSEYAENECESYESALIKGLDWIIEQEAENG